MSFPSFRYICSVNSQAFKHARMPCEAYGAYLCAQRLAACDPLSTHKLIICLLLHVRVLKGFVPGERQSCGGIGQT